MLTRQPRTATARAVTSCVLKYITKVDFDHIAEKHREVYRAILEKARDRLERVSASNAEMAARARCIKELDDRTSSERTHSICRSHSLRCAPFAPSFHRPTARGARSHHLTAPGIPSSRPTDQPAALAGATRALAGTSSLPKWAPPPRGSPRAGVTRARRATEALPHPVGATLRMARQGEKKWPQSCQRTSHAGSVVAGACDGVTARVARRIGYRRPLYRRSTRSAASRDAMRPATHSPRTRSPSTTPPRHGAPHSPSTQQRWAATPPAVTPRIRLARWHA